jgi:chromosomal replication initiation ATPase DnaA
MALDIFLIENNHLGDSAYTLDNFYTNSDAERQQILSAISKHVQAVIILSEVGMGGTHLLAGIYKELKGESASINYEKLIYRYKKEAITSLNLQGYKYLFLDDWHAFYNRCENDVLFIKFIENEIDNFIAKGGKVFLKINPLETAERLKMYFSQGASEKIQLDKVEKSILKRMLEDMCQSYSILLEKKNEEGLLSKQYSSYRVFQNDFISMILKNKNIN